MARDGDKWKVTTIDVSDRARALQTHEFDAVIVCNGLVFQQQVCGGLVFRHANWIHPRMPIHKR